MYLENPKKERKLPEKRNVGFRSFWVFLAIVLIFQATGNVFAEDEDAAAHRTATAIRITGAPPQVDGILDDEIWKNAPLHEGFRQREPDEAKPATERITFQIAYDDEALYFGVMCYDSEPDKIVSRLVRRDTDIESDRVTISLARTRTGCVDFGLLYIPQGLSRMGLLRMNITLRLTIRGTVCGT